MSPRVKTASATIDRQIEALLDACGATEDRDLLFDVIASGVLLAGDDTDRLDLKIAAATLAEMRVAFNAFAPYRDQPKVTIFGSARILADDPLYLAARDAAALLAAEGWMVITGAGPGIMAAGLEGAGREMSFGVNIRLPFEQEANEFIRGDTKLVSMKYFFTRKLELVKESQGFLCLPGGFGTLDETFELLTLQQTGKSVPTPIVFLDEPGGSYWEGWRRFTLDHVAAGGYISAGGPRHRDRHRRCRGGRRGRARLLPQLPLDPMGGQDPRRPPGGRTHRRRGGDAQRRVRGHVGGDRPDRAQRPACLRRSRTASTSIGPAW